MSRGLGWGLALIALALLLGTATAFEAVRGFDSGLLRALALLRGDDPDWAIAAAQGVTWLGDPGVRSVPLIAALVWLGWKRLWSAAFGLVVTIGIGVFASSALKEGFARARPELVPPLDVVTSLSYPSGHAANAMLIYLSIALVLNRRWVWAAAVLALAIGVTRVLLGVHWPVDVLGGWLLGAGCALAGHALGWGARPERRA